MKLRLVCLVLIMLCVVSPSIAEDPTNAQPIIIPLNSQTGSKKRMPSLYSSFLEYYEGDISLHTSMSYEIAWLDVYDTNQELVTTLLFTSEQTWNSFFFETGFAVICTFDNGTVLCGSM